MQGYQLMAGAAAPMVATVRTITTEQLDAPTPCQEYDVRRLLNHLLYWGPSLVGAATGEGVAPPAASEQDVDLTDGDWAGALAAQTGQLAAAWGVPQAWEGTTRIVGPNPLPAPMIGGMVLTELVVHCWDLARATGQQARWEDQVVKFVYRQVERTAEQGRSMGAYGPLVAMPDTSPELDRTLGLTGRDPNWKP